MIGLSFGYPLALLGLLVLPVVVLAHRWRPLNASPVLRRVGLVLRLTTLASLVLALAHPILLRPSDAQDVLFAVDVSQSMQPSERAAALDWVKRALATKGPNDQAGLAVFGAEAQLVRALGPNPDPALPALDGDGTSLQAAIRTAEFAFHRPAFRRVVVLSDGGENLGRSEPAARLAASQDIEISTVPILPKAMAPEVLLESMESPQRVREGEPVETMVIIYSTIDVVATVRFWTDGQLVSEDSVRLEAGPNRFVYDHGSSFKKGFHSFHARVDAPQDTIGPNNELDSFTVVVDRAKVLIIEGQSGQGRTLTTMLRRGSVDVDVAPPSFIPPKLAPLRKYDALVLYNVPATTLSLDQMQALQSYVQVLGKGLVAVGGKESFGPGSYANTPLEETLPVSMTPPSKQENPSLALVIVLDKSGSMDIGGRIDAAAGTTNKMAMAKQAASLAMDVLDGNDEIGVLQFDMTPRWVVPPTPVGDRGKVQQIRDQISAIRADGGTEIFPALQMAYDEMQSAKADLKHIVLLTDGRSFSAGDYDTLLAQMRQEGITLSTIAVGGDADTQLLEKLADRGNGRYYFTDDPRGIPKIVTDETATASANQWVETDFKPRVTTVSPILRHFSGEALPSLQGYVVAKPKPTAQIVIASHLDDPILAQWQYGLGRSVAFLSTIDRTWSADWLLWGDLQRFWAQALRWAMPSPLDGNVQVTVDLEGPQAHLQVDVVGEDGAYVNLLDTGARVSMASPAKSEPGGVPLRQTAPGRYEGASVAPTPGAYVVQIIQKDGDREVRNEIFGFVQPYSPELRPSFDGPLLLQRVAAAGGGGVMEDPAEAFRRPSRPHPTDRLDLWQYFLALALVLFPLEIGLRRRA